MVEYTAIFPSQSADTHERLKHLPHISGLSQSSLVAHRPSESKSQPRPQNHTGGLGAARLVQAVAECRAPADRAVQSSCGHVAKECQLIESQAGCLL